MKFSIVPLFVHNKSTTGTQTLHTTLLPVCRQRGQQMNGAVMTLHKHLADTCRHAEVTVNLERRMGIKEVWIGTAVGILSCSTIIRQQMQHILDNLEGMVAIEHTCPEIRLPSQTPTRSHITTLVQRIRSSGKEFGM